jgi:predicted ATP-grasp superfamily ATP-dependent carboligase
MSLLATDGEQRSTLAVVRALGAAGVQVAVGSSRPECLAGSSRYCTKRICYPPPEDGPAFVAFLLRELTRERWDVLLPMTDLSMQLLAPARSSIPSSVRFPIPGQEQVTLAQDKQQMLYLAGKAGIACPRTIILEDTDELEEVAKKVQYPVVIKPRFSRCIREGKTVSGTVQYAHDPSELIALYRRMDGMIPRPLIQEKLEGEGKGVFLLVWNGELKAAFCHRRLREKPPWGGASVYCESVPLDQDLVEKSFALLKAVGWQGVAMVEFKVDQRDRRAKLMEVNGRFWGSLQLAVDAGVNFPLMLYRLAMGENVSSKFDYRVGVKSRWLLGDLDHLLIRLTYSGPMNGAMSCLGSKSRAMLKFMKLYETNMRFDVMRLDDPGPAWFEMKKYVADIFFRPRFTREAAHAR